MGFGAGKSALEIPFDELDVRDQIGGGGFSLVYRAFWKGTPVVWRCRLKLMIASTE